MRGEKPERDFLLEKLEIWLGVVLIENKIDIKNLKEQN
jgi:hypothetical protein